MPRFWDRSHGPITRDTCNCHACNSERDTIISELISECSRAGKCMVIEDMESRMEYIYIYIELDIREGTSRASFMTYHVPYCEYANWQTEIPP